MTHVGAGMLISISDSFFYSGLPNTLRIDMRRVVRLQVSVFVMKSTDDGAIGKRNAAAHEGVANPLTFESGNGPSTASP